MSPVTRHVRDPSVKRLEERIEELEKQRSMYVDRQITQKTLEDVCKVIRTVYQDFSEEKGFEAINDIPKEKGVYIILKESKIIYVGLTENLQRRFKQLWGGSHILHTKLLREVGTREMARNFLKESRFLYRRCQNMEEGRLFEQVLIYIHSPKYNE